MDSGPPSLEQGAEEAAGYSTLSGLDPMPYESEVSLSSVLETVLPRYGLALEAACRCAVCESQRAARLAQALHNKFGHAHTRTNGAINELRPD
jgi:hypothetical protein